MSNQYKELCTLYDRTKDTNGEEFVNSQPIYQTCSLYNYSKYIFFPAHTEIDSFFLVQRMKIVLDMYLKELETKKSIVLSGIRNIITREEGVVLLSIWINQPSIVKSSVQEWEDICTTEMELLAI